MINIRYFILPLALSTSLLLASCGKKPADTTQTQPTPTAQPETAATSPEEAGTTPSAQPATVSPAKPEPYAGLEIPNPPPPPKHSRLEKDKAVWGVMRKTLPEVVEFLGMPSSKKEYGRGFYPDGWLYEWETVVTETKPDGSVIEYPKMGVSFKDRDGTPTQVFLNEYLTGEME